MKNLHLLKGIRECFKLTFVNTSKLDWKLKYVLTVIELKFVVSHHSDFFLQIECYRGYIVVDICLNYKFAVDLSATGLKTLLD